MSVDLLALLSSGELHRRASESRSQPEFTASIGMTQDAYGNAVRRLRAKGVSFPGWDELRGHETSPGHETTPTVQVCADDFSEEEKTNPDIVPLPAIPPGHVVKGVSTFVDETGATRGQWIKTHQPEQQRLEALLAALPAITEPFRGMADPVEAPQHADEDLLAVYYMGDPHLGMHSWAEETGDNFDLQIAEQDLVAAIAHLVAVAPPAKRAIIMDLGDFFHFDNENVTTTSGTRQDGDTRWSKVLRSGIRAMRHCNDLALAKHELVEDFIIQGNHDHHTSIAMALALEQFYEREPRVRVDTSPNPYKWCRFGNVLIMATHGHNAKPERLMGVMATDRASDWGETQFRYIKTGHVHHSSVKELPGVTVETFPTLAPKDAWHHAQGYRAHQSLCVDTYHRRFGHINRSIVGVAQLRAKQSA